MATQERQTKFQNDFVGRRKRYSRNSLAEKRPRSKFRSPVLSDRKIRGESPSTTVDA
jgi:hypothetical protein